MSEGISTAHYWTKATFSQQVVVDPLAADAAGMGHGVISLRVKQVDIVAPVQILEQKSSAREKLVQKP